MAAAASILQIKYSRRLFLSDGNQQPVLFVRELQPFRIYVDLGVVRIIRFADFPVAIDGLYRMLEQQGNFGAGDDVADFRMHLAARALA